MYPACIIRGMDARHRIPYIYVPMRLLLLLSAFLTALTGAVAGTAASAQPVQASAIAAQAKQGAPIKVTAPLPEEVQGAYAAPGTWHVHPAPSIRVARAPYGERRRE